MSVQQQNVEETELKLEMQCINACKKTFPQLSKLLKESIGNPKRAQALEAELNNLEKMFLLPGLI